MHGTNYLLVLSARNLELGSGFAVHHTITCISRVLAIFPLKFPNFRCHGNRGRSDVNSNDTGKLLDLVNSVFGATLVALCLILAELWLILS